MVGIHQLPTLLNLDDDFGDITFLDELGMDMLMLNTANKLNPNVDISGLSCRLSKHTREDQEVLGAIDLELSIQVEIFLDCFCKSINVITITVLLGLGSLGLGGSLGGLLGWCHLLHLAWWASWHHHHLWQQLLLLLCLCCHCPPMILWIHHWWPCTCQ